MVEYLYNQALPSLSPFLKSSITSSLSSPSTAEGLIASSFGLILEQNILLEETI